MRWHTLFILAATCIFMVGCHGRSRINPFVGFGSPRVAPPPTRPPSNYYPGAGAPAPAPNTTQTPTGWNLPRSGNWQPVGTAAAPDLAPPNLLNQAAIGTGVQPTVATLPTNPINHSVYNVPPGQVVMVPASPPTNQPAETAQLNPMRVNDATQPLVPGRVGSQTIATAAAFSQQPYMVINPQPVQPVNPIAPITSIAPVGTAVQATAVQPTVFEQPPTASQGSALGWRPKYLPGETQLR